MLPGLLSPPAAAAQRFTTWLRPVSHVWAPWAGGGRGGGARAAPFGRPSGLAGEGGFIYKSVTQAVKFLLGERGI